MVLYFKVVFALSEARQGWQTYCFIVFTNTYVIQYFDELEKNSLQFCKENTAQQTFNFFIYFNR